jgi:anti-sigma B factor antagonist
MPTQEDVVFAKIVVHNKLLSQEKVDACLKMLKKAASDGNNVPLPDVVLHNKLLSQEQVNAISWAVQYTLTKARDKTYAQILQTMKLATLGQINGALEVQQQFFAKKKQTVSILDILVNKGILKRDKTPEIIREAEKQSKAAEDGPNAVAGEAAERKDIRVEKAGSCKVAIREISLPSGRKTSCLGVAGALDADSFAGLQRIIGEIIRKPTDVGKYIILNLEGVDYMSSSGVGVILSANKDISTKGGVLMLANVKDEVKDIMALVGLDSVLGFYTMDEALKKMEKAK